MPVTLLLRALGWVSDEEIMRLFSRVERVKMPSWDKVEDVLAKDQFQQGIGRTLLKNVVDKESGEIVVDPGTVLTEAVVERIEKADVEQISVTVAEFPHHLIERII